MAEAVVQAVIGKVGSVLSEVGDRVVNLPDKIESLRKRMSGLQPYLKDAESKDESHPIAKMTFAIRDLAQEMEDVLDTYSAEIETGNTKGPFGFVKQLGFSILCHCMASNEIAKRIEELDRRATSMLEELKGYVKSEPHKAGIDEEVWSERKKFLLEAREPQRVFGREEIVGKLKEKMRNGNTKNCIIITIFGPAGVGKTTVARKIYKEMKGGFDCSAMVYVSHDPKEEEILRNIAKQVGLGDHKMDENLVHNLNLFLQNNRFLIFLDDVWSQKTWELLRNALMVKSENGSRIIVTSRYTSVGKYIAETAGDICGESMKVPLGALSEDSAEQFFKGMISSNYEDELNIPVKEIGDKIVAKCDGLPLAIEVVAGMLRGKPKIAPAWDDVLQKMNEIPENDCLKILALSYKDLPPELKPLFLYFGIFPDNHEIFVPQLIPLWLAENFIPDNGNQNNYVEQQIEDLRSRNLVHVCKKKFNGRVRSFRIHNLVHHLCRRLAEKYNYFCTLNYLKSSRLGPVVRRVTINTSNVTKNAFKDVKIPKIRALFCFSKDEELFKFLKENASDLKFLRLLIIEFDEAKVKVPEEIANLSGLIYLKMTGGISEIPEGIRRLRRLQTLEIRSKDIPEGILKMKHVKHLFLSSSIVVKRSHKLKSCIKSRDVDEEVEVDLPNLESLEIDFGPKLCLTPSSVKKLTNLKRLGIYVTKCEMLKVVFPAVPVLQHLEALALKIYVSFFNEIPMLDLGQYQCLKKLTLYFDIAYKITRNVVFPRNVIKITLKRVTNLEDDMDSLKMLPNLERLRLLKCRADKLDFSGEDSFPKLQYLTLEYTVFSQLIIAEYEIPTLWRFRYLPSPVLEDEDVTTKIPERLLKLLMEKDIYEEV